MRGIFFDEDDARSAALALARGGFEAVVVRERLAGEDDDEDHPWAVVTDAPAIQLEMLVETYDGWLDADDGLDTPGLDTPGLDTPSPSGSGYSTNLPRGSGYSTNAPGGSGYSTDRGVPLPDQPKRIKRPSVGE